MKCYEEMTRENLPLKLNNIFLLAFNSQERALTSVTLTTCFFSTISPLKSMIDLRSRPCDALRNLVPFIQFEKCEKHP